MKARLKRQEEIRIGDGEVLHLVVWELRSPVLMSNHLSKYSLAYVCDEVCVVRYDNERGKGDHLHAGQREFRYGFVDLTQLELDFRRTVREWRIQNGRLQRED